MITKLIILTGLLGVLAGLGHRVLPASARAGLRDALGRQVRRGLTRNVTLASATAGAVDAVAAAGHRRLNGTLVLPGPGVLIGSAEATQLLREMWPTAVDDLVEALRLLAHRRNWTLTTAQPVVAFKINPSTTGASFTFAPLKESDLGDFNGVGMSDNSQRTGPHPDGGGAWPGRSDGAGAPIGDVRVGMPWMGATRRPSGVSPLEAHDLRAPIGLSVNDVRRGEEADVALDGADLTVMAKAVLYVMETTETIPVPATGVLLGRSGHCNIRLEDPSVSLMHARVYTFEGRYRIQDLDSRNGVQVNETTVTDAPLRHRDIVHLGRARLRFMLDTSHLLPTEKSDPGSGEAYWDRGHGGADDADGGQRS